MKRAPVWKGYYDVVILPPPAVRDYAIALSRELQGPWVLGKRRFLPHVSLYHIPIRDSDLDAFTDEIRDVAAGADWGPLETTGFDGALLMLDKPEWLIRLQKRVVRRTVRYFDRRYGAEKSWSLRYFSDRRLAFARQYLRQYGTPMHGMNFRPHLTLSTIEPRAALPFRKMRFRPSRLDICELGISHSCQRIIPSHR